jgi:hypothetical protein
MELDIRNWDVSSCETFSGMFNGCRSLTNVIGGVDGICGAKAMVGARSSFDISTTNLDLPSIIAIFLGIGVVDANSNVSIKINTIQKNLANDYLGMAKAKIWKIIVA